MTIKLTKAQARKIILHAAGLSKQAQFGKGKEAVYKIINHHHSIAARVPDYKQEWLEELQQDGRIFEFWTFASGFIPMHNFRFSLPVKENFLLRRSPKTQAEINLMNRVFDRISREGPLMARDFENDRVTKSTGWWDWRPSKLALEWLHLQGKLVTTRRKDFQKVYDISENIVPSDIDVTKPTPEEYAKHIIIRSLRALGIAYLKEIAWSDRFVKTPLKAEMQKLIDAGEVYNVEIEGLKGSPLFMLAEYRKKKIALSNEVFILSPFDILNVFRHRLRDFFDFDYQVECFVPKPKRKYGYFALPILIGDTFVARMDSKAERKERVLVVHNLHFEKIKLSKSMLAKIGDAIWDFAQFNECDTIKIKKSNNKEFLKTIRARFNDGFLS
jgi:uncharacterized protein YcaQ